MFSVSLCLCPLRFIKADYRACCHRSTHSLLPLDLLTPPVACLQGAHAGRGEEGRGGEGGGRGPAATSHSALVPGRGSYSSPLLCWAFWPLRVEVRGGWLVVTETSLLPPAPPVWPQAQDCDRLDAVSYTQTCILQPDDLKNVNLPFTLSDKTLKYLISCRIVMATSNPPFELEKIVTINIQA